MGIIAFHTFIEQQIALYMKEGLNADDARDKAHQDYHNEVVKKSKRISN